MHQLMLASSRSSCNVHCHISHSRHLFPGKAVHLNQPCQRRKADSSKPAIGENKRVVVVGGGIIGASISYYLAEKGVAATVVERDSVACAASGNAGGFLALDWNDNSPVGGLARLSYKLHADLAKRFDAEAIGYRAVHTLQVSAVEGAGRTDSSGQRAGAKLLPSWIDSQVLSVGKMGSLSTTAQVHPRLLTHALMDSAQSRGAQLVKGTVTGLRLAADGGGIHGVLLEGGQEIAADAVVLAMGPWTAAASAWLDGAIGLGGFMGQKYHSIVLRPQEGVSAHCLFTSFKYASGRKVEPEVYPRPDGTVYVCGEPQDLEVPPSPSAVHVEPQLCDNIRAVAASLSSSLAAAPVEAQQACYLPIPPDGLPVIGEVPGVPGVFVASGHSCWGILNGPATGMLVAELLVDAEASCLPADCVQALSPDRLAW